MREFPSSHAPLRASEQKLRAACISAAVLSFVGLRFFEPSHIPAWLPIHPSCGAITGLPCLFCGLTRAIHHLLQGNFAAALYYNWLALPISAGAVLLAAIFTAELIAKRKIFQIRARFCFTPRSGAIAMTVLVSLWLLQVYLAISQDKRELLNPSGPLYALFVR